MKHLLLFGVNRMEDMVHKGNIWYVRHYEQYFDKVTLVYLTGAYASTLEQGNTRVFSVGSRHYLLDLILAPFRLYQVARKTKPTTYLTADIIFSWWTTWLTRLFLKAKITLMPVCQIHLIYHEKSNYFLPKNIPNFVEKIMFDASFYCANAILLTRYFEDLITFFKKRRFTERRVKIVDVIGEEYPTVEFYNLIDQKQSFPAVFQKVSKPILLAVSRLAPDKCIFDLIDTIGELKKRGCEVQLMIAGEGPLKTALEERAREWQVAESITFLGSLRNVDLVPLYQHATLVISTLTGTALREAALCGAPIVCYRSIVVDGFLEHGKTGYIAESNIPMALADQVEVALHDVSKRTQIATAVREKALHMWGLLRLRNALTEAFQG